MVLSRTSAWPFVRMSRVRVDHRPFFCLVFRFINIFAIFLLFFSCFLLFFSFRVPVSLVFAAGSFARRQASKTRSQPSWLCREARRHRRQEIGSSRRRCLGGLCGFGHRVFVRTGKPWFFPTPMSRQRVGCRDKIIFSERSRQDLPRYLCRIMSLVML